jgi:hypothetical protein
MRFYNPQLQQPISTFVPDGTPWDMILKAGAAKEEAWADTEKNISELPNLFNLDIKRSYQDSKGNSYLNPDYAEYEQLQNATKNKLNELAGKDLSDPLVRREILGLKNNISSWINQKGKRAEAVSKAYKDSWKTWSTRDRSDKEQGRNKELDYFVHGYTNPETGGVSNYGDFEGFSVDKYTDLGKIVNEYGAGIKSELTALDSKYKEAKLAGLPGAEQYKIKKQEILNTKVANTVAEPAWQDYQGVAEREIEMEAYYASRRNGTSQEEELLKEVGKDDKGNPINFYQYRMMQEKQNVYNNAYKFVSSEGEMSRTFDPFSGDQIDKIKTTPNGFYSTAVHQTKNTLSSKADNFKFKAAKGTNQNFSAQGTFMGTAYTSDGSGKKVGKDSREFDNASKKAFMSVLRRAGMSGDKNAWDAYFRLNAGKIDLTEEQKNQYYPMMEKYFKSLPEVNLSEVSEIPMTEDQAKVKNLNLFGKKEGVTIKEATTGIGQQLAYMDEDGNIKTLQDILKEEDPETFMRVVSSPSHLNTLNLSGSGNYDFTDAVTLNIGGKRYWTTDLQSTDEVGKAESIRRKMENAAYSVSVSHIEDEIPLPKDASILISPSSNEGKVIVSKINKKGVLLTEETEIDVNDIGSAYVAFSK